ncbi:MAG: transporter substrate-binding domain-containing protein [Acidaminococcaceae bacterium]|nr:transporter substrate-binding domain-containing protein [Acidaminococcaceae bacterium]
MKQMPSAYNKNRILSLWLCLTLLLTVLLPVSAFAAASGKKIVRVGWFESTFNITDQNGRRSGYAYEYQQKIAAYTGWEYQYVTASWSQLLEMLRQGEIDLLSDVSYTQERAQSMLYSSLPMGRGVLCLYCVSKQVHQYGRLCIFQWENDRRE